MYWLTTIMVPAPWWSCCTGSRSTARCGRASGRASGSIYRVIAPDLRGHGETAAPEGVYTMEQMADDVIELLDALQISEPIVLGGLSMGGYVALALVARYPERVRGLMLMDTRAAADTPEAAPEPRGDLAGRSRRRGRVEPVVEGMLPRLFSGTTRGRAARSVVDLVRR